MAARIELPAPAVFGFETALCHAATFWEGRAIADLEWTNREPASFTPAENERIAGLVRRYLSSTNYIKMLSYFPVVGTVMGVTKFYIMATSPDHPLSHPHSRIASVVRTTIETLSLGVLLIVPDLIVTDARQQWAARQAAALRQPA